MAVPEAALHVTPPRMRIGELGVRDPSTEICGVTATTEGILEVDSDWETVSGEAEAVSIASWGVETLSGALHAASSALANKAKRTPRDSLFIGSPLVSWNR